MRAPDFTLLLNYETYALTANVWQEAILYVGEVLEIPGAIAVETDMRLLRQSLLEAVDILLEEGMLCAFT